MRDPSICKAGVKVGCNISRSATSHRKIFGSFATFSGNSRLEGSRSNNSPGPEPFHLSTSPLVPLVGTLSIRSRHDIRAPRFGWQVSVQLLKLTFRSGKPGYADGELVGCPQPLHSGSCKT